MNQYGNRICLCTASLSPSNTRHGGIFCLVWSCKHGRGGQNVLVSWKPIVPPASLIDVRSSLIFPRWDVIALVLSMFLMTYTYIEAKSNYHRGSILILRSVVLLISKEFTLMSSISYLVLTSGFYFAPATAVDIDQGHLDSLAGLQEFPGLSLFQTLRWYLRSLF